MAKYVIPQNSDTISCDHVVIGSGAGGALTAAHLAKRGGEVLILEEGPGITVGNGEFRPTDSFPRFWREGGFVPIWGESRFVLGEGRVLGGSTMVNAGLINRVSPAVLAEWRDEYGLQLTDDEYAQHADAVEQTLEACVQSDPNNKAEALLKKGADSLGYAGAHVPIAMHGTGEYKNSMLRTYLAQAFNHGARVITDCRVKVIRIADGKAHAIEAVHQSPEGRVPVRIRCATVHVCAGTLQTALLLRRSGITKNVGNSVRFHPTLRVTAQFSEGLASESSLMPSFQVKEFAPNISIGASMSLLPFVAPTLALNRLVPSEAFARIRSMATYYVAIRAHARGTVRNLPFGNYMARYSLDTTDRGHISRGYAELCRLLFAAGATRLYPAIASVPYLDVPPEHTLLPVAHLNLMTIHSFSSCPAGENTNQCAADSYGRVYGFENLYINDASMLPNAPGVNPQGPLMALASRNMEHNFPL